MRYMKMLTGSKVSDEAFMTRNRICALLADLGSGLSDCSSRMARRPIGVAALSRPSPLAAKFRVISPSAGWPGGTSGMSRRNKGASKRPSVSMSPAASAMRRKPSHKVSVPNSRIMTWTESSAMSNRPSTMREKTSGSSSAIHWYRPDTEATIKKASQSVLSMERRIWAVVGRIRLSQTLPKLACIKVRYCSAVALSGDNGRIVYSRKGSNMNWRAWRRQWLTEPLYRMAREAMPRLSATEKEAIEAGDVWWDAQLFRSEEHTSELQSLMRISYAVFCLQKKKNIKKANTKNTDIYDNKYRDKQIIQYKR